MPTDNAQKDNFAEYKAITHALQSYVDSAKTGDASLVQNAFYDHAKIAGSMDGNFAVMSADDFKQVIDENPGSPNIEHHIAWIDISGPAAAVKIEFVDWLGFRFTDFLLLHKSDGQWKISGKVFDSH